MASSPSMRMPVLRVLLWIAGLALHNMFITCFEAGEGGKQTATQHINNQALGEEKIIYFQAFLLKKTIICQQGTPILPEESAQDLLF